MRFKTKILLCLIWLKLSRRLFAGNLQYLRRIRFRALRRQLLQSPYYVAAAKAKGGAETFPYMNKKLFVQHFDEINTRGIQLDQAMALVLKAEESRDFTPMLKGLTLGLSSGTSGNRSLFMASERERALWVASVLDRVIGFSLRRRSVAFFLRANSNLYSSVGSSLLNFQFFDLLKPLAANIQRLSALQPDLLVAQPSMLMEIAKAIERKELRLTLHKVISVAEVLSPEDRLYLERIFKQIVHQVYQCTEGFLASTCEQGTLHFHEDFLIIEKKYVDAEHIRFHPVITDLLRFSQPVIRYELNDLVIEKHHCPCGSRMLAIEQIEGRSDDVCVFTNDTGAAQNVFPDFFRRAIILSSPLIEEYALVQKTDTLLQLYVTPDTRFDSAAEAVQAFLLQQGIRGIQINKAIHNGHQPGSKLRRIKNENR